MVVGSSRWFFQGVYPTGFFPKLCRLDISTLDIIPPFRFGVWMVCFFGEPKKPWICYHRFSPSNLSNSSLNKLTATLSSNIKSSTEHVFFRTLQLRLTPLFKCIFDASTPFPTDVSGLERHLHTALMSPPAQAP